MTPIPPAAPLAGHEELQSFLLFLRTFAPEAGPPRPKPAAEADELLDRINEARAGLPYIIARLGAVLDVLGSVMQASSTDAGSPATRHQLVAEAQQLAADLGTVYAGINRFYEAHGLDQTELKKIAAIAGEMKRVSVEMSERFPALPAPGALDGRN